MSDEIGVAVDDDEEAERVATARADDISFCLDERGIAHETYVNSDGEDGWHLVITAGHEVHGSPLRQYTLTYATAEGVWSYQEIAEDGREAGPHVVPGLTGRCGAVEVAAHIAAEIGGTR